MAYKWPRVSRQECGLKERNYLVLSHLRIGNLHDDVAQEERFVPVRHLEMVGELQHLVTVRGELRSYSRAVSHFKDLRGSQSMNKHIP